MILVDPPKWPWRDALWGHMVSDVSFHELHQFAQKLGKRRIGFQGDHYDIDQDEHRRAVEAGATSVDSRQLVRRLRDSGLRRRTKQPPWEITYQSKDVQPFTKLAAIINGSISSEDYRSSFLDVLMSASSHPEVLSVLVVERHEAAALILELDSSPKVDTRSLDLFTNSESEELTVFELIMGNC